MDDYWWILDAIGHRRHAAALEPEVPEWMGAKTEVINVAAMAGDLWICDFCNEEIMVTQDDGQPNPVPMLAGNALCSLCMMNEGMGNWATTLACACPPCMDQAQVWEKEIWN